MYNSNSQNSFCCLILLCAATALCTSAQNVTLWNFDFTNGAASFAGLVQATDGDLYGTTAAGGANNQGTVFKVTPTGTLTTLYNFCADTGCTDGGGPYAGLIQATNGNFYGTTHYGGTQNMGTVFKITPTGAVTTLHSFDGTDGLYPTAGLVQATDGDFYGITNGADCGGPKCHGTVYKITPRGTLTSLYTFCSDPMCTDGYNPYAGLIQGINGNLYGTTTKGGVNGRGGTVFEVTPSGTLTTLYSFCSDPMCTDGFSPNGLLQVSDGDLYGTTAYGGTSIEGSVFQITPNGRLTTLYSVGVNPVSALIQASNGTFYGTTAFGGDYDSGNIFEFTPGGALSTVYVFEGPNGYEPSGSLVQATNGDFYGMTVLGGEYNDGTLFRLSVGLSPFVETQPNSGRVGADIKILGTDLTGATSVTFDGVAATFTLLAPTEITTTVPSGATTGKVQVITPTGTLSSNIVFRVQ